MQGRARKVFSEFWAKFLSAFLAQSGCSCSKWDFKDMNAQEDLSLHVLSVVFLLCETGSWSDPAEFLWESVVSSQPTETSINLLTKQHQN